VFQKRWEVREWLHNWQLLKKGSAPWVGVYEIEADFALVYLLCCAAWLTDHVTDPAAFCKYRKTVSLPLKCVFCHYTVPEYGNSWELQAVCLHLTFPPGTLCMWVNSFEEISHKYVWTIFTVEIVEEGIWKKLIRNSPLIYNIN
jgi:hypothetical protein